MELKITPLKPFGSLVQAAHPGMDARPLDIPGWRTRLRREHLLVLRGFRAFDSAEAFAAYCELWGEISLWPFGKVLELVEHEKPDDHMFAHNYVPLHWDGMYRPQVPEFQIFQCVSAPLRGQGGRTTFSNTEQVLETASPSARALWSQVTGHYRRKMEFYDSHAVSPVVTTHPQTGAPVIRYNEPPEGDFLNPPDLEFTGVNKTDLPEFHRSLQAALHAPDNYYAHEWVEGDIVLTDNYTLLHGREAFTQRAPRHLRRVHVLGSPPLDNPALVTTR